MPLPPLAVGSCWTSNVLTKSQMKESTISPALALSHQQYSHDSSSSLPTFGCMEKDANILLYMSFPPPPPYGKRLPGRLCKSCYFFGFYLKFLLVKMTSWWPLRSSAEMVHEIQVWLIIISQPKSSYWKSSPACLVLGRAHDVIKKFGSIHSWTWLEKDLCSLFPWWGGGEDRGLSWYRVKC